MTHIDAPLLCCSKGQSQVAEESFDVGGTFTS